MDPATIASLFASGGQITGGALNTIAGIRQNKKSRQFALDMFNLQDSTQLRNWHMQNAYNDPSAQMERLRKAGLNPALIYGAKPPGASGNSSPIGTPQGMGAQFNNPNPGGMVMAAGNTLAAMYDLELKQAQIDNVRADNTVKLSTAALNRAGESRSKFDLNFDRSMIETSSEMMREQLRKLQQDRQLALNEDERRTIALSKDLYTATEAVLTSRAGRAKTAQEIENLKQLRRNLKKDQTLKQLDINLKRAGVQPHHPLFAQMVAQYLRGFSVPGFTTPKKKVDPKNVKRDLDKWMQKQDSMMKSWGPPPKSWGWGEKDYLNKP